MYPASVIAYAFVKKGIEESNPVTQMKLQKMVYFAHGAHLALFHQPLIYEDFQAWKFGPVVPSIYHDYKLYGSAEIDDTFLIHANRNLDRPLDDQAKKVIDITWDALKNADALRLSAWTHKLDSPWQKHYKDGITDIIIPNDEIESYFTKEFIKK